MKTFRSSKRKRSGITVPEVLVTIAIISLLLWLLMPAVQSTRETARRSQCQSHLRQIGIAIENYESLHRVYPNGFASWAKECLPFTEQNSLAPRIQLFESGQLSRDQLRSTSVPLYLCPSDPQAQEFRGWAPSYVMNDGFWPQKYCANGFFRACNRSKVDDDIYTLYRATRPADFTDGLSNTAALAEKLVVPSTDQMSGHIHEHPELFKRISMETIIATSPDDLDLFAHRCQYEAIVPSAYLIRVNDLLKNDGSEYHHVLTPNLNSCYNGNRVYSLFGAITANSMHPGGVNLLLGDGSVRFIGDSIDLDVWRAIATRAGNDFVNF